MAWPASGTLTQRFGNGHAGIDIAAPTGSPVKAAAAGTVVVALKSTTGYGWRIIVDHGNGYTSLYAHLSAFNVAPGAKVARGQLLGAVGATGLATGPHVHFEVGVGGVANDPLKFLP
jgi:murein DD-endopeptidase MepM/ murein hydrolase activator NlpD